MTELFAATGRRCRVMTMTGKAVFAFLRGLDGRAAFRLYGMPADTRLIGTAAPNPGVFAFLLESSEWEPVKDGDSIPEISFEMLTALLPPGMRLEKPKPMLKMPGKN